MRAGGGEEPSARRPAGSTRFSLSPRAGPCTRCPALIGRLICERNAFVCHAGRQSSLRLLPVWGDGPLAQTLECAGPAGAACPPALRGAARASPGASGAPSHAPRHACDPGSVSEQPRRCGRATAGHAGTRSPFLRGRPFPSKPVSFLHVKRTDSACVS